MVCFSCGKSGHAATRCPNLNDSFPFMQPGWWAEKTPAITDAPSCPVPPCNFDTVTLLQESCEPPAVGPLCRFEVTGMPYMCNVIFVISENISIHDFKTITQTSPYTCSLCKSYDEPATRSKHHVPPHSTTLTVDAPVVTNRPERPTTVDAKTFTSLIITDHK